MVTISLLASYAFVAATLPATPSIAPPPSSPGHEKQSTPDRLELESATFLSSLKQIIAIAVPLHPSFDVTEFKRAFLSQTAPTRMVVISEEVDAGLDAGTFAPMCDSMGVACMQLVYSAGPVAESVLIPTPTIEDPIRQFSVDVTGMKVGARPAPGLYVLYSGNLLLWKTEVVAAQSRDTPIAANAVLQVLTQAEEHFITASLGSPPKPIRTPPVAARPDEPGRSRGIPVLGKLRGQVRSIKGPGQYVPLGDSGFVSEATKKSSPVVLVFWGTWCAPCRAEMPTLDAILRKHPRVAVLGLLIEEKSTSPQKLVKELASVTTGTRLSVNYVARDRALLQEILQNAEAAVPSFAVFDRSGRLLEKIQGAIIDTERRSRLERALQIVSDMEALR